MPKKSINSQPHEKKILLNSMVNDLKPVFSRKEVDIFKKMCIVSIKFRCVTPDLNLNDVQRLYKHILELSDV